MLKLYLTVYQSEQGIVGAKSYVCAGSNLCSALSDYDVTCQNVLTVSLLYAKALRLTITAVLGRTNTLFMSEKLQTEF
jgi:Fe-S-cluster-containing dehydrogenase component